MSLDELQRTLSVDLENGMCGRKARELLLINGPNELRRPSYASFYITIARNIFNGFSCLLWFTFILCAAAYKLSDSSHYYSYLVIGFLSVLIIFAQVLLACMQTVWAVRALKCVSLLVSNSKTLVIRNHGLKTRVCASELVVGDVVLICVNEKVCADIRLVEVKYLKMDRSILTGESEPVNATLSSQYNIDNKIAYLDATNMVFAGTMPLYGHGKGIVVATGDHTAINSLQYLFRSQFGIFTKSSKRRVALTFFQKVFNRFGLLIFVLAMACTLVYLVVWACYLRLSFEMTASVTLEAVFKIVITTVPLPMPIAFVIALVIEIKRLRKLDVVVKNLDSIDLLSSMNVCLTDKTGTLTQNRPSVANLIYGQDEVPLRSNPCHIKQLLVCSYLCNNYRQSLNFNSIDSALYEFSDSKIKHLHLDRNYIVYNEMEFKSENRCQVVLVKPRDLLTHNTIFDDIHKRERLLLVKGAPDVLKYKSKFIIQARACQINEDKCFNEQIAEHLTRLQNKWSNMGRSVIMLCKKVVKESELNNCTDFERYFRYHCNDLTIVGLIGLSDPPRVGITDSIAAIRESRIRVVMVTGDYKITAASTAFEIGILSDINRYDNLTKMRELKTNLEYNPVLTTESHEFTGSLILTGTNLESLTKSEWRFLCNHYKELIFARTTAEQKLRCIQEFQLNGHIVGMIGDGVNDVPALRHSNTGIAMGSGTKPAMEASHVILLNNSFSCLAQAIHCCRLSCENVRKIMLYFLSASVFAEITFCLMSKLLGLPMLLNNYTMLIIMFTDLVTSLALIFEKREKIIEFVGTGSFKRKNWVLFDYRLVLHGFFFLGLFTVVCSLISIHLFLRFYTVESSGLFDLFFTFQDLPSSNSNNSSLIQLPTQKSMHTIAFITVVFIQIFGNLLSTRTLYMSILHANPFIGKMKNLKFFMAWFIDLAIVFLVIFGPGCNDPFGMTQIPVVFFVLPLFYSFILIGADEARKAFVRSDFIRRHEQIFNVFVW